MRENPKESARLCFHLPLELSTEILARLPAKTLLKFRCVCKEWNSLIHNPNFTYLHLNLYKNNRENSPLMIVESKENHRDHLFLSLRSTTAKTWSTSRVKVPGDLATNFRYPELNSFYANCYVKGLLLWKQREERPGRGSERDVLFFILWNPSVRKYQLIPPPFPRCLNSTPNGIGLGYDSVDNDVKLVFLKHSPTYTYSNYRKAISVAAYIYSVKNRSWRNSTVDHQVTQRHYYGGRSIPLCGAVHWATVDYLGYPKEFIGILAFNVRNEVFSYFPMPRGLAHFPGSYSILGVLGESLALLLRSIVWVMEEYGVAKSWVRRYKYDFECPWGVLYFSRNGVIFTNKKGVKAYDLESGEIEDLEKDVPDYWGIYMDTFEDNLMLLGEVDDE